MSSFCAHIISVFSNTQVTQHPYHRICIICLCCYIDSFLCYREPDKGFIGGINLDKKFTDRDQSTSTISILADKQTTPPHICVLSEYY